MNVFELLVFVLLCAGLGFLGHLVSPRHGWDFGALPVVAVLILLLIGTNGWKTIKESFQRRRKRERRDGAHLR
jgi:hypothetical protein